MGHTYAKVKVYSHDQSTFDFAELLVDTGSTYTWIGADVLEKLGTRVRRTWKFRTIDGRIVERKIGDAYLEYMEEQAPTVVVFAENSDGKVLGVHALEGLRLEVDPSTEELRRSEASLALFDCSASLVKPQAKDELPNNSKAGKPQSEDKRVKRPAAIPFDRKHT